MIPSILSAHLSKIISRQKDRNEYRLIKREFDRSFYISQYPDTIGSELDPIEHYRTQGWRIGLNPHAGFDTLYYRGSNPDVERANRNPFVHFLRHGRKEGRVPKAPNSRDRNFALDYLIIAPEFDVNYYLSRYPDVRSSNIDPIKHYIFYGWKEGRNPRSDFNTGYYCFCNSDLSFNELNPFRHYIEIGRAEGRQSCAAEDREPHLRFMYTSNLTTDLNAVPSLRPCNENDYCLAVPFDFIMTSGTVTRVAAVIHVYYTELLPAIIGYITNVPVPTDLFISTDTIDKKAIITNYLREYLHGKVEVRVFENRGRDIAPFIVGFSDVFERYEYFIHLHTKRSPHGGGPLEGWLEYILLNLLGSERIVKSVFSLFENENVGIVFPQHLFALRGILNWGYDFEMAADLLRRAGFHLDKLHLLEFPSGSMFWGRSAALRPLLDLDIEFAAFPDEAGQVDGTLAHAIERSFLFFAEIAGFRWAKIISKQIAYPIKNTLLESNTQEDVSSNLALTYRPLLLRQLSGITATEKAIKEVRRIIYFPSSNKKPRLNLLVPTINPHQTFGGVSTALKMFDDLERCYNTVADFRIIVTDAAVVSEAGVRFKKYSFRGLSPHDTNSGHVIVEAVERRFEPLTVRSSDIFVATAWWTADLAFEAIDVQKKMFKKSNKLIYLIQDFEPNFYGWSSNWILADNTLRRGDETVAVINSYELCQYLLKEYLFDTIYYIGYKRNGLIRIDGIEERQKIIIFYGRPHVTRNLFEILVDGISLWQQRNPTIAREWRIVSLGEEYSPEALAHVCNVEIGGKLSLEDYSTYLRTASVGISLMLSPHPSYPPLEMAEAGVVTITNSCFGKNLSQWADNIIALDKLTDDTISEAISNAIIRVKANAFPLQQTMKDPNMSANVHPNVTEYSAKSLGRLLKLE
ncbi:Lipopolysaccharide biosynthesis protein-like protein [Methylocella tundrae]|uniref:Lipopolysaccharide biosynthesis protein-like protein n=1 Tax=Methylocella tundrae TaxID=227605 RepID=A0A8B6M439_METTU|nr:rhamnan synthesis F family protein [Methylocella tundrae]VTZ25027.1 Lipopolysaccharide biosynthesis protein-like protein [Methylocella tundrae]VTZ49555.1 Lipopolysaccharide biosynthesis protein-like protein [Methylocella tundrae]